MALTKVGGGIIQQPIDVGIITATSVNASGVVTATSFDGNVTGDITGNVTGNLTGNVTGNVTGNLTGDVTGNTSGTAGGLTGTPDVTVGSVTATTGNFSGNLDVGGVLTYEDVTNVDAVGIVTARIGVKASNIQIGVTGGTEIDTTSGNLTLDSAGGTTTVDDYLTVTGGGNVSAGDWRFTGASNKHVTWDNSEGALEWENNAKATFGTGDALQIYHSGSESVILDAGTGQLNIRTDLLRVNNTNDNETLATFVSDGAVSLYYDNSKKFETSGIGATVYGTLVSDLDLTAIDSTISDTAVDVFIYDTSKDSDGGAWRKRTQHTSWYNETLNTSTRGSRREFPAVAVIVSDVTTDKVTIYDGDDPDLPMWMVISGANPRGILGWATANITSIKVTALNGILVAVTNDGGTIFKFVEDFVEIMYSSANYNITSGRTIADRNNDRVYDVVSGTAVRVFVIVTYDINDVAMTVLPNAPIDDATGLPTPTIAVATQGGVSVIKDDGNVVSKTTTQLNSGTLSSTYYHKNIDISGENAVVNYEYAGGGGHGQLMVVTLSDLSVLRRYGRDYANTTSSHPYFQPVGSRHRHFPKQIYKNNYIFTREQNDSDVNGDADGILTIYEDQNAPSSGLINRISSSYNTGWMHGDIKGAFLSDTDDTNITGSNIIDNGDFGSNFTNWSIGGDTTPTISSGGAKLSTAAAIDGYVWQSTSGEAVDGKWVITWTLSANTSGFVGLVINGTQPANGNSYSSGGTLIKDGITASGSHYYDGAITAVEFRHRGGGGGHAIIDNITLRRVEDDRSVNNKGLEVHGTITKTAVATGADLVAYSGWSSSNYLIQPYNSDLDFGTGDWSYMFWYNPNNAESGDVIFSRWSYNVDSNQGPRVTAYFNSGNLRVDTADASAGSGYQGHFGFDGTQDSNNWHCAVILRRGLNLEIWIDGINYKNAVLNSTSDGNYTDTNSILEIGHSPNSGAPEAGLELALFRASASAPSPEQIKKIYEDEKVLFQENAKATLYGSSDAVKALAYDDDTDLLHVGTSSGRSDFQGLRRINNTTTAVTTAITAQNEFIIEQ